MLKSELEEGKTSIEFNASLNSHLKSVCEPFLNPFGIKWFSFVRIYNDEQRLIIHSNESWLPHYFEMNLQNDIAHTKHLLQAKDTRYILWEGVEKTQVLKHAYEKGLANGMYIYKYGENSTDIYGFATLKEQTGVNDFYLNNKDILNYFVYLFLDKFSYIFEQLDDSILIRPNRKVVQDSYPKLVTQNHEELTLFSQQITPNRFYFDDRDPDSKAYGTRQEVNCLEYLVRGYTVREVGNFIDLSPKTVESYIRDIKNRLGIVNTAELLKRYSKLRRS